MPTQNVNLPEHQAKFIQQRIRSGKYQNASEVVRAGLRLLEQREAEDLLRLQTLKRVTRESFSALDRGEHTTFTPESLSGFFEKVDRTTGRR